MTIEALAKAGYCMCWFGPVVLHSGHCCFRADDCPAHPFTDQVKELIA